ncbi:hypothetical protein P9578_30140 [Brevibacillus choshinensis]|nr:hypothetical protein [Brevibacillus choshinensis]
MNPIEEFEQYLVENGIAPKTIESYVGDVELGLQQLVYSGKLELLVREE